ncbi:MAG: cupredoxin domain-containing protein [Deltaproteobacteria bacterium]|nr:cupredoxin domain-containing protein [Deltaproteobacteria bacterium]MBI5811002.1 cupredoxin domain-containing protein [Deltaproteobacteria bacterium]
MRLKNSLIFFPALIAALAFASIGYSAESEVLKKFLEAHDSSDPLKTAAVIEENKASIPAEVKALLDEAALPSTTPEKRDETLYIAEMMAKAYKDATGDIQPIKEVKKVVFNSKLSSPAHPAPVEGVYIIEMPEASDAAKNLFRPDNLVIKKGATVRWMNKDKVTHVFATMPLIGMTGMRSPNLEPGQSWEYKFEKPGEYYYLCFIHQGMVGKVTVEE